MLLSYFFDTQAAVADIYGQLLKQKYVRMGECILYSWQGDSKERDTCAVWNVAYSELKLKFGASICFFCMLFQLTVSTVIKSE